VPGTWQAYEVPASEAPGPSPVAVDVNQDAVPLPAAGAEQPSSTSTPDTTKGTSPREETSLLPIDTSHHSGSASTSTALTDSTEECLVYGQTMQANVYEGPGFNPEDAMSAHHELIIQTWDGAYYPVQQQQLNVESTSMYMPQMAFFPPPVVVQTIPLPVSTPPPESCQYT
jgi:hypothetical protein